MTLEGKNQLPIIERVNSNQTISIPNGDKIARYKNTAKRNFIGMDRFYSKTEEKSRGVYISKYSHLLRRRYL